MDDKNSGKPETKFAFARDQNGGSSQNNMRPQSPAGCLMNNVSIDDPPSFDRTGGSTTANRRANYKSTTDRQAGKQGTIFEGIQMPCDDPYQTAEALFRSRQLRVGDPIEFEDPHWALYAGEQEATITEPAIPMVVHFFSFNGQPHTVRYDALETAACGKRCRINKKYDSVLEVKPVEEIMRTAHSMLGRQDYNIVHNNCEHFVTGCRYGFFVSEQVQEAGGSFAKQCEIAKMGEWKSPEVVASEASVGDLIEFDSGQHQHWAIFAGRKDNISFLIHLWQEFDAQEHKVRYDDFPRVAAGRRCRVNNKYDHNGRFPAEEVIRRAHSQLNNCGLHNKPFEMFRNNCEHFASWCRNGQPFSEQSTSKDLVFKFMARAWHEISNGQNPSSGFSS